MARLDNSSAEMMVEGAAATGDILFQLGVMYSTGRSVPLDYVAAHKWFNLAALRGSSDAARHRKELAAEMSSVEIATAQREAREWLSRH